MTSSTLPPRPSRPSRPSRPLPPRFTRRSLLEKAGLGVATSLAAPILLRLEQEARGANPAARRVVFLVGANGMHPIWNFTPPDLDAGSLSGWSPLEAPAGSFAWPRMLRALAPYRDRTLLLDGFENRVGEQHTASYGALSCVHAESGVDGPRAITVDQLMGRALAAGVRYPSVLFGSLPRTEEYTYSLFASAPGRAEPFIVKPSRLATRLFGAQGDDGKARVKRQLLLDSLRHDLQQARTLMADRELDKLNRYLGIVNDFDKRNALPSGAAPADLPAIPPAPAYGQQPDYQGELVSLWDMGVLALTLGLTNVLGISAGAGRGHGSFFAYPQAMADDGMGVNQGYADGHSGRERYAPGMDAVHNFHASLIARLCAKLDAVPEGDGSMMDNTLVVFLNDNGEEHHSEKRRWPVVVVGGARQGQGGARLRTDGRYIRYAPGTPLADLFVTIAQALQVTLTDFGATAGRKAGRPIAGLLT